MTTESYVRDPRFIAHGAAIKWSANTSAQWYDERQLRHILKTEDWSDTFLVCHHCQFDGLILSHHYGVHPKMLGCTLSMARLLLGNHLSVSLEAVRKHFGMPSKRTPYNLFDGKHWEELTQPVRDEIAAGACDETESIWNIFGLLLKTFPREELEVIDITLKMFTEPRLVGDIDLLSKIWVEEAERKQKAMADLGVTEAELQSAERFAELLRAEGVEPELKPGKPKADGKEKLIYAFAKTDQFMRDLLEEDDDRIRTLTEARLGQKSNITQTRAETLGWMARRGSLCVYLNYAGAGTLRPSGGDGANWLNLKRRSPVRKSIQAPEGYLLAPIDASQIECRCLHYLAGGADEPVVQKFRNGEDPYVDLASLFYGEKIYKPKDSDPRKEEMEAKRGMGKQGRLMCLGADTKVLTRRGFKRIIDVTITDQVWDGTAWVEHEGLIYQGEQDVENFLGVKMTSDHLVLCGPHRWLPAACLRNENTQSRALAEGSANLPSSVSKWARRAALTTSLSNVAVARQNTPFIQLIYSKALARVVAHARQKLRVFGSKNITAMQRFARIKNIAADCSGALVRSLRAVIAKPRKTITPTELVAYESTAHGFGAENSFYHIWLNSKAGTTQNSNSIGETTIEAMFPVIYDSLPKQKTSKIGDQSKIFKLKSPVYDLRCAGPKNRFTILSERGPLIVHNCGYGAAGPKFKITAKNGLYGPPVDIPLEDAMRFVKLYRQDNTSICAKNTGYWAQSSRMLARLAGGEPCDWGPLHIENHRIYLPNGAPMIYDTLEFYKPPPDEAHKYKSWEIDGFWRVRTRQGWKTMHGPKLTQNICEAVSRVIVSQAAIRIARRGYRILNWPYDELLCLIPRDGHEDRHVQYLLGELQQEVSWLPGLPLDAEVTVGERYSK